MQEPPVAPSNTSIVAVVARRRSRSVATATECQQEKQKWSNHSVSGRFSSFFIFHFYFDSCSIDSEQAVVSGNVSTLAVAPGDQHPALSRTRSPTIRRSTDEHGTVIHTITLPMKDTKVQALGTLRMLGTTN